ncbi:MAG: hypothetical protein ABR924_17820 [Terracidiphilus sp.]
MPPSLLRQLGAVGTCSVDSAGSLPGHSQGLFDLAAALRDRLN